MPPKSLQGRRALVMGGSKGLGFATAQALAEKGARIAICARGEAALKNAANQLGAAAFVADLAARDGAARLMEKVETEFGSPDILVVNTGGPPPAIFDAIDDDKWRAGFEGLWMSAVQAIRASLPHMRQQKWGRVLLVTSIAAREPIPNLLMSSALRAGLHGMINALSREVAADGVTVNALMPGYTLTERLIETGLNTESLISTIPARRLGRPEEFAALAAFLASEDAGYITGQAIACDGGALSGI